MSLIICGFPGVGKSTIATQNNKIVDHESRKYEKTIGWERNYINDCKKLLIESKIVLMTTHDSVRKMLKLKDMQYYLVYPDKSLKDEYLLRYRSRGSSQEFIESLDKNWDNYLRSMDEDTGCIERVVLKRNEFLKDVKLFKAF